MIKVKRCKSCPFVRQWLRKPRMLVCAYHEFDRQMTSSLTHPGKPPWHCPLHNGPVTIKLSVRRCARASAYVRTARHKTRHARSRVG